MYRWLLAATLTALLLAGCGNPCDCPNGESCDSQNQCITNTGGGAGGGSGGGGATGGGTGGGGSVSCGSDTWTNYASTWFRDNCANCHSSEFGSYTAVTQSKSSIDGRISGNSMPPGGLSSGDRQRILSWFSCDMPQ